MIANTKKLSITRAMIATLFSVIFLFSAEAALAFGVTPDGVNAKNLINGIEFKKTINLLRSNPSTDSYATVKVVGPAAQYIVIPGDRVVLPKGERSVPITIGIKPVGAPNGEYRAGIIFAEEPKKGTSTVADTQQVSLSAAISIAVVFTVTDKEILGYDIKNVIPVLSEENQPLNFYYQMENTGNVNIHPDELSLTLFDPLDLTKAIVALKVDGKELADVKPGETSNVLVVAPVDKIAVGKYSGNVTITKANQLPYTKEGISFQVLAIGALSRSISFDKFYTDKTQFPDGELVKFYAKFKNDGQAVTKCSFQVEIYQNNKLIDSVKTDPKYVSTGVSSDASLIYTPKGKGQFKAVAIIDYEGEQTEPKEINFKVGTASSFLLIGGISGLAIIVLVVIGVIWFLRRKKGLLMPTNNGIVSNANSLPIPDKVAPAAPVIAPVPPSAQVSAPEVLAPSEAKTTLISEDDDIKF